MIPVPAPSSLSPCALLLRAVRLQHQPPLLRSLSWCSRSSSSTRAAISGVGVMQGVRSAVTTTNSSMRLLATAVAVQPPRASTAAEAKTETAPTHSTRVHSERSHSSSTGHISHSPTFGGDKTAVAAQSATNHQHHLRHQYLASTISSSRQHQQLLHCHLPAANTVAATAAVVALTQQQQQQQLPSATKSPQPESTATTTTGAEKEHLLSECLSNHFSNLPDTSRRQQQQRLQWPADSPSSCAHSWPSANSSATPEHCYHCNSKQQLFTTTTTRRHSLWSLPSSFSFASASSSTSLLPLSSHQLHHQRQQQIVHQHRCYGTLVAASANRRMNTGLKVARRVIASSIEGKNDNLFHLLNDVVPVSFRKLSVKVCGSIECCGFAHSISLFFCSLAQHISSYWPVVSSCPFLSLFCCLMIDSLLASPHFLKS